MITDELIRMFFLEASFTAGRNRKEPRRLTIPAMIRITSQIGAKISNPTE